MRNFILVICIVFLYAAIFLFIGCGENENNNHNGNGDNDTTEVPDTTKPDSTGFGTMTLVNTISVENVPARAKIYSNLLITSTTNYNIEVFSLADPQNPQKVGEYSLPAIIMDFVVTAQKVYAISGNRLFVIGISTPSSPQYIGEYSFSSGSASCVAVGSRYAYVGLSTYSGFILDIVNPEQIRIVGTIPVPFSYCDYFNGMLYCATNSDAVYAIDVTDTNSPHMDASAGTGGQNLDIAVTPWGYLYIAAGTIPATNNGRFIAFDVRRFGLEMHSETIPGFAAKSLAFQDNFVYLLMRPTGGIHYPLRTYFAYHIDDMQLAFTDSIIYGNDVAAGNGYVYVAARSSTGSGGAVFVYEHQY